MADTLEPNWVSMGLLFTRSLDRLRPVATAVPVVAVPPVPTLPKLPRCWLYRGQPTAEIANYVGPGQDPWLDDGLPLRGRLRYDKDHGTRPTTKYNL